jgi:hypothetical protein
VFENSEIRRLLVAQTLVSSCRPLRAGFRGLGKAGADAVRGNCGGGAAASAWSSSPRLLLQEMRLRPDDRIADLAPRQRCRECAELGKVAASIRWWPRSGGGWLMPRSLHMLFVRFQTMQRAIYVQKDRIVLSTLVQLRDRTDTTVSAGFGGAGVWKPLNFE